MGSKWDIEKFITDNDFGLWKVKMEMMLINQKCEKALKGGGVLPVTMSQAEKTEMVDKARSAIVLCLGDKAFNEFKTICLGARLTIKVSFSLDKKESLPWSPSSPPYISPSPSLPLSSPSPCATGLDLAPPSSCTNGLYYPPPPPPSNQRLKIESKTRIRILD